MGLALYRKYRSRTLDDIVGQEHVTTVLRRAIDTDRVAHAYLFTGPRGVGKTSIARILAHEINHLEYTDESSHLDIIEIDAASNNGVDDIRDLREKVQIAPSSASKKVYIIDEVHMLSKAAFNALLKTLEEPPAHVVFILATTDADKLPMTIISRTQRHSFRRASTENIVKNLAVIAKKESLLIDSDALELIAEHSDGSYRDSVSLLDQLANTVENGNAITVATITDSLGLAPSDQIEQLLQAMLAKDFDMLVSLLRNSTNQGIQPSIVASQLIARIVAEPQKYAGALDTVNGLMAVRQSSLPDAALLVAVTKSTQQNETPAPKPTVAAKKSVAAIVALEQKAIEEKPIDDIVSSAAQTMAKSVIATGPAKAFDWQLVIDAAKDEGIGLHSVATKCSAELRGNTLVIYAKTEFYKKKLETTRMSQSMHTILKNHFDTEFEIEIIPGSKELDNSQLAHVAAMMGGGEEVDVSSVV